MNHPVEGSRYRWPGDRREFVVVGTGLWYGVPGFVVNSGGYLSGYPLSWWKSLFQCPEPESSCELDPALLSGRHWIYPQPQVHMDRDEDGNLSLIETHELESVH